MIFCGLIWDGRDLIGRGNLTAPFLFGRRVGAAIMVSNIQVVGVINDWLGKGNFVVFEVLRYVRTMICGGLIKRI